jgi:hypothetical protein
MTLEDLLKTIAAFLGLLTALFGFLALRQGNEIRRLKEKIEELKLQNFRISNTVNPESDSTLIKNAKKSIQILDIHGLQILHHCREDLIEFLKKRGGILQVLLMDPTTQEFVTRQDFEDDRVGRIRSEWQASVKILLGIRQKAGPHSNVELRLFDSKPDRSLLIVDALDDPVVDTLGDPEHYIAMMINYYPVEKGTRGYTGGQFLAEFNLVRDRDSFVGNRNYFKEVWDKHTAVDPTDADKLVEA